MEYKSGDRICGCTLRQMCGRGAYGEVWLADMDATGARVAVKIISNQGRYSERELAGLRNYKDCSHPNLLNIRFVELTGERICCIMDAADDLNHGQGEYKADTLANRLNKFGRMDGKEITAMLDGLLAGLEELHKHGLVHRDIKPDNILWVNGRPTLADVGLITLEGKGSLVGTPGFMSPKLLSGQGQADTSDDFYALGKVIYCALTGLPVGEYPSIPENMTISLDASLGRAFRESCKHPVRSSAEFRSLLQGKSIPAQEPDTRKPNVKIWKILAVPILILLLAASALLWRSGTMMKKRHEITPDEKKMLGKLAARQKKDDAALKALKTVDADAAEDLRSRVLTFFREKGFLPGSGSLTPVLLKYEVMRNRDMLELLRPARSNAEFYAVLHMILFSGYLPDFKQVEVKARQEFWRKQTGTPVEIQRKMLESDLLMQALAVDSVIRQSVNSILKNGQISEPEKAELQNLLRLRRELLDPDLSTLMFMEKRFSE